MKKDLKTIFRGTRSVWDHATNFCFLCFNASYQTGSCFDLPNSNGCGRDNFKNKYSVSLSFEIFHRLSKANFLSQGQLGLQNIQN